MYIYLRVTGNLDGKSKKLQREIQVIRLRNITFQNIHCFSIFTVELIKLQTRSCIHSFENIYYRYVDANFV